MRPSVIQGTSPAITAWPPQPLPLPSYRRRRYELDEDATQFVAVGDSGTAPSSGETCIRLLDVDTADPHGALAFVNAVGTVGFGEGPESQTLAEFELTAQVVRDAVSAWRLLREDEDLGEVAWSLPRLHGLGGRELAESAAEFLSVLLESGLGVIAPTLIVSLAPSDEPPALDLSLYAVCCIELFNHIVSGSEFRLCANESCDRLFVRDERARKRGVLYCSRACARAQAQREFRRRKAREAAETA